MAKLLDLERQVFDKEYFDYRKKWIGNPKNHLIEDAPLHLDIELTNVCNLSCPMCSRTMFLKDGNKNFNQGFMSFDLYKKIIDEASDLKICAVKLIWRGESTLHKDLVKFVAYAKEKGIIDVMINTNGLLLTESLSKELIKAGIDKIIFSLDSDNKETYDKIRIGSNFDVVITNIKDLKRLKNEMNSVKPISFASMIKTQQNYKEEQSFIAFYEGLVDNVFTNVYVEIDKTNLAYLHNASKDKALIDFKCTQLWQRIAISFDGKVAPCCIDDDLSYVLGNLNTETIHDIWHSEKLDTLRRLHIDKKYNDIELCKYCVLGSSIEL